MTFTIGRFTSTTCGPYDIEHDGDRLRFRFDITGTDTGGNADVAIAYRQQLLGLIGNPDEQVVPIVWTDDATWDGFYRIGGVSVEATPAHLADSATVRHFVVQVDAVRVGGYALPLQEVSYIAASRDTTYSVVTPWYLLGLPATAIQDRTSTTRTTEDSDIYVETISAAGSGSFPVAIEPSNHYSGSCVIQQQVNGSWYPVVGNQFAADVSAVRISNGLVRVSFTGGTPLDEIQLEVYEPDEVGYEVVGTFKAAESTAGDFTYVGVPAILHNAPDKVTIQAYVNPQTAAMDDAERVTFSVTRGVLYVSLAMTTNAPASADFSLRPASATAATALTGGIRQTSDGATGHRWVMASAQNFGSTLASGIISSPTLSNVTSFYVMLGVEFQGSTAATPNTAAELIQQYWGVVAPDFAVVAR